MNFTRIFGMQRLLDMAINSAHTTSEVKYFNEKRIVALLVELGEFANEYAAFKYWKKNKQLNKEALLEEFVDGIHFLSSMAIDMKLPEVIEPIIASEDHSMQLLEMFKETGDLAKKYDKKQIQKVFGLYLGIAKQLKITDQEIEAYYIKKNKTNFERIKNNY